MVAQSDLYTATTGYTVASSGAGLVYYTVEALASDVLAKPRLPPPITGRGVLVESTTLEMDAGALVRDVVVSVTAEAAGELLVGDVATVRAEGDDPEAASHSIIIDFNGLRTISSLVDPATLNSAFPVLTGTQVAVWAGSAFAETTVAISALGEVLTERLRVDLIGAATPAQIRSWRVTMPTPPSSIELSVNGTRAWAGLLGAQSEGPGAPSISAEVDLTAQVAAAALAGDVPVRIELTSPTPANLGLDVVEQNILSRHLVGFPEGASRTLVAASEGVQRVDLPLDGVSADINIHRLELTVKATVPETRVAPAIGPTLTDEADIEIDVDRSVVVRLPAELLAPFATLSALRVAVAVEQTCELAGVVHEPAGDDPTVPGEPIAGATLTPTVVEPSEAPVWVTLPLVEPVELDGRDRWISITPSRGRAGFALAPADPSVADSTLLWRAPSGFYRSLSFPPELPELVGAVRVVGTPAPGTPVGSTTLSLPDRPDVAVVADPPSGGQRVVVDLGETSVEPTGGLMPIDLLLSTDGEFVLEKVDVFYRTKGTI